MSIGRETIVIHRVAVGGRFGEKSEASATTVTGCAIVPRSTSELDDRQDTVLVGLDVYAPPTTDILPTDEVTARETRYKVVGEPGKYITTRGRAKVVKINLERVT